MIDIICSDCGETAKEHGCGGRFVPRWPDSPWLSPMELVQTCPNTEAGLLRHALMEHLEKERLKETDLKTVARVVNALVPFGETVRPTDDLNNPKYRFVWNDLVELSRIAHGTP